MFNVHIHFQTNLQTNHLFVWKPKPKLNLSYFVDDGAGDGKGGPALSTGDQPGTSGSGDKPDLGPKRVSAGCK